MNSDSSVSPNPMATQAAPPQVFRMVDARTAPTAKKSCGCGGCGCGGKGKRRQQAEATSSVSKDSASPKE